MFVGLTFEIAEGGFLDIDVKIVGPDGRIIYQGEQESSGKYTFAAHTSGVYTYCFSNQKSTMTPKVVMFNMDIDENRKQSEDNAGAENQDGDSNHGKLDDMIKDLSTSLWGVKNEQEYMQVYTNGEAKTYTFLYRCLLCRSDLNVYEYFLRFQVRDRNHRAINESTNFRVVVWAFFEAMVLVCVTTGQIFYLKRFFEVRRIV